MKKKKGNNSKVKHSKRKLLLGRGHRVCLHIIVGPDSKAKINCEDTRASNSFNRTIIDILLKKNDNNDTEANIKSGNNEEADDNTTAEWVYPPAQHKPKQISRAKLIKLIKHGKASSRTVKHTK